MKTQSILCCLSMLMACVLTSCEKELIAESNEDPSYEQASDMGMLTVLTRAAVDEGEVSYPVAVYVMQSDGTCVAHESLTSASDELSLSLPAGAYMVYAVGGVDASSYQLPDEAAVTTTSEIVLNDGAHLTDLMTSSGAVTLGENESNQLTLTMQRRVMQLETVEVTQVPAEVEAVEVSLYPIYDKVRLNGTYTSETSEQSILLTRQGDGSTWRNSSALYMLPAAGNATVKVSMTIGGQKHSYSYSCPQALEANHKVSISGEYTPEQDIHLTGTITGAIWGTPTIVSFSFGEGVESNSNDVVPTETVPEANKVYKDCFVLSVEDDSDGQHVIVTLLHKKAVDISAADRTKEDVMNDIETALPSFNINGITGWRLPTADELRSLGWGAFNDAFKEDDQADKIDYSYYYCLEGNELVTSNLRANQYSKSFDLGQKLRPVSTLRFEK